MSLNLDNLTPKMGAKLPENTRGREATPIPAAILTAVKDSYALPKGQGATIPVPNGELNDKGNDVHVAQVTGLIRRAAKKHGMGVSISIGERGKTTTPVSFKAKDFTARPRKPKTVELLIWQFVGDDLVSVPAYVIDNDDDTFSVYEGDDATEDGARLATADELSALGYVADTEGVYALPDEDGATE